MTALPASVSAVLEGTDEPKKAPRSVYEYMGNKKWLQAKKAADAAGQVDLPGIDSVAPPLDLDERYTTRPTLAWCMMVAGVEAFDLDVAACAESHKAPKWYGLADDGLQQPWFGRVWANVPYSDIGPWVEKAWRESEWCDLIAMLVPATRTEQPWWSRGVEPFRDGRGLAPASLSVHFLPGRQTFGIPGNAEGIGIGSPPFGVVLLVWRRAPQDPAEVTP